MTNHGAFISIEGRVVLPFGLRPGRRKPKASEEVGAEHEHNS